MKIISPISINNNVEALKVVNNIHKYYEYGDVVEYIESDGNSYVELIDISNSVDNDIIIEYDCMHIHSSPIFSAQGIVGSGINVSVFCGISQYETFTYGDFDDNVITEIPLYTHQRFKATINYTNGTYILNGQMYNFVIQSYGHAPFKFILFGYNNRGDYVKIPCRNYSFKYTISSESGHLIPIKLTKKPITDVGGRLHPINSYVLYDIISNTVPAHFGEFIGGDIQYNKSIPTTKAILDYLDFKKLSLKYENIRLYTNLISDVTGNITIESNIINEFSNVITDTSALNITLEPSIYPNREYIILFTTGDTTPIINNNIIFTTNLIWSEIPTFLPNTVYEINIMNNLATWKGYGAEIETYGSFDDSFDDSFD